MSSSAKRALRILDLVARADRPLTLSEIARQADAAPATAFRALDALERAGFVARYLASSRYVLGPAAERLRQSAVAQFRMRDSCLPHLRRLASTSGETASLFARIGWYAVRIASVPGAGEIAHMPPLADAAPLGGIYAGCAILACLAAEDIRRYRAWARARALPDVRASVLRSIRARGFSIGAGDFSGGHPVAVPVFATGQVAAALAVEGPALSKGASESAALSHARTIAQTIESLARAQPRSFENPFAHLDPDRLDLG